MIRLILVRHGETDDNIRLAYLGWTDALLNQNGIKQSIIARDKLKFEKVDKVYSSPLKRCYETSEIINENFGLNIITTDNLKERNFGEWDNLTYFEIKTKFPNEHDLWIEDWINYKINKGESAAEAFERTKTFIDNLLKENENGCFLVTTHLGCIRNIISYLLGMGIEGSWRFRIDNAGISYIEINEGFAVISKMNV